MEKIGWLWFRHGTFSQRFWSHCCVPVIAETPNDDLRYVQAVALGVAVMMIETETSVQAVAMMVVVFLGMRVLYGSWPWEGHKTWYATQRLQRLVEEGQQGIALSPEQRPAEEGQRGIALSPEQIAHAVASAASITKSQLENAKSSERSGERADFMVTKLPSDMAFAAEKTAA